MGLIMSISGIIAGGSYLLNGPMWLTIIATIVCVISFLIMIVRIGEASSVGEGIADAFFYFPDVGGGGRFDGWSDGGGDSGGSGGDGGD